MTPADATLRGLIYDLPDLVEARRQYQVECVLLAFRLWIIESLTS